LHTQAFSSGDEMFLTVPTNALWNAHHCGWSFVTHWQFE
jgi:hypothetical protein